MSETWSRHYQAISDLIAANPVQRYAPPAPPTPAPAGPTLPSWASGPADGWQGGANQGDAGAPTAAGTMSLGGGFPNASTIASALDINPAVARAGMTALGLLSGPLGMGIGAANMAGNIANTTSNYDMLSSAGVSPGVGSVLGGLLGFNGLAGTPTSALNAAMANQYAGFAGLSPAQMQGDFSMSGWGGWGDIAAQMDAANAAASAGSTPSGPSGGMADRGDISSEQLGDWQKGGYTGAGRDGIVQPHRVAGRVHEGELVIPHHMVRRMGLLGR